MAKLDAKRREKLPAKDFAGPGRSYPIEDKAHARNAKARASQAVNEDRMSKREESKIDRKADAKLEQKGAEKRSPPVKKAPKLHPQERYEAKREKERERAAKAPRNFGDGGMKIRDGKKGGY